MHSINIIAKTSLDDFPSNAGNFQFKAVGKFGFPLKTSLFRLKPFMFFSESFAANAHDKANSRLQPASSIVLATV